MSKHYAFVPTDSEWHFIDQADGRVLLAVYAPEEVQTSTDIDDLYLACETLIESTRVNILMAEDIHGNTTDAIDELPRNAADIMASALYEHFVVQN